MHPRAVVAKFFVGLKPQRANTTASLLRTTTTDTTSSATGVANIAPLSGG